MRIGIATPTNWPHVRRGGERFVNELATDLARRGHEVTVVCAGPGAGKVVQAAGFTTIYHRRLWHPALAHVGLHEFHAFLPYCLASLLRRRFDVVFACNFLDAWAATRTRRLTGAPCVFLVNSVPPLVPYVRSLSLGGRLLRAAFRDADEVISVSRYMQVELGRRFGREGTELPVPVDLDRFRLAPTRDRARPVVVCASALDDPRKGGTILMRAFNHLKARRPEVVLEVAAGVSESRRGALLGLVAPVHRADVRFLGAVALDELPGVLGRASLLVLPSMWESFGMVILESLACGTPVVGTRDGAIPELISNREVGRLFDPGPTTTEEAVNEEGLAEAMAEALELSTRPETAGRCRTHAEQYGWDRLGPRFETLIEQVVERRRGQTAPEGRA
jgi:glycosyltransferase involved in cell wall biosynthesis